MSQGQGLPACKLRHLAAPCCALLLGPAGKPSPLASGSVSDVCFTTIPCACSGYGQGYGQGYDQYAQGGYGQGGYGG